MRQSDPLFDSVEGAIRDGIFPGAVWKASNSDREIVGVRGRLTYCPDSPIVTEQNLFDLASVSKVVATTSMAMLLVQRNQIDLSAKVASVLPEFGKNGKEKLTFGNLLRHDAGLAAFRPFHKTMSDKAAVLDAINQESLQYLPGSKSIYSDLSMIVLAEAMEQISGKSMPVFLNQEVFAPLKMGDTGYFPDSCPSGTFLNQKPDRRLEAVPTERIEEWRRRLWTLRNRSDQPDPLHATEMEFITGEVHDPTATVLGGVAGHAGLFSTVNDLWVFLKNLISPSPLVFQKEIIQLFTKRQSEISSRALGWDTKSATGSSAGRKFGPRSFGHTGYTGTSVWCDPDSGTVSVLLSNRVHPTSENTKIVGYRPIFHDLVWDALASGN